MHACRVLDRAVEALVKPLHGPLRRISHRSRTSRTRSAWPAPRRDAGTRQRARPRASGDIVRARDADATEVLRLEPEIAAAHADAVALDEELNDVGEEDAPRFRDPRRPTGLCNQWC
jgi:hypothetical protein